MSRVAVSGDGILGEILRHKRGEVEDRRAVLGVDELRRRAEATEPPRGFKAALDRAIAAGRPAVIAEIKRASPSKGLLREPYQPATIARSYAAHGAACLSVLTDRRFFQGDDADLQTARAACPLPALRKDFTVDPYQLYEARALGADAILLIVAALDDAELAELYRLSGELSLDALIEVHDRAELDRALTLGAGLIGVNNRDLRTFETRLETTLELSRQLPAGVTLVTESGIHSGDDVARMRARGIDAFLVGEAFMRSAEPGVKLAEMFFPESGS